LAQIISLFTPLYGLNLHLVFYQLTIKYSNGDLLSPKNNV